MTQRLVLKWDGTSLPGELRALLPVELRDLAPGRYGLEPLPDDDELTAEEEAGILEAIEQIEPGQGIPWDAALRQLRAETT